MSPMLVPSGSTRGALLNAESVLATGGLEKLDGLDLRRISLSHLARRGDPVSTA